MKNWLLIALTYLLTGPLKAEELFTLSLISLVQHSPIIFSAKPLLEPENIADSKNKGTRIQRFLVLDVLRQDSFGLPDTVAVSLEGYEFRAWEQGAPIEFDTVILYGDFYRETYSRAIKPLFQPAMSGIRLFHQDSIFVPIQLSNPGGFYFAGGRADSFIGWKTKTTKTIARLEKLLAMRQEQPASEQNQMLMHWIRENSEALKQSDPFSLANEDSNWGELSWQVFEWINGNGIWQDAWDAMLLSKELYLERPILGLPEGKESAFNNEAARAFLLAQIAAGKGQEFQAMYVLSGSLWTFGNLETSISAEKQTEIIGLAFRFLHDPNLRYVALQLLENAAFAPEYDWRNRNDLSYLPALKELLEQLKPSDEDYFRNNLIRLIARMKAASKK